MSTADLQKLALTLSFIACPNCGGTFHPKPEAGALTNIRCKDCFFEARFLTFKGRYTTGVFSISKPDLDRILREKILLPPFIFHWAWEDENTKSQWEAAVFYPFIPHKFLKAPDVPISLLNQNDDTLVYIKDEELLSMMIYNSPNDEELAEIVSNWETRSVSRIQRTFPFGYARAACIMDMARNIRRKRGLPDDDDDTEDNSDL